MGDQWWEHEPRPAPPRPVAPPQPATAPSPGWSGGPAPAQQEPPPGDRPRRRLPLALSGIAIVLAGVVGAAVLWAAAEGRHEDTIADFARAPAGCDTTLSFDQAGRFVLYVETEGQVDPISGDCDVDGAFLRADDPRPPFELMIVGAGGERLALGEHGSVAYDSDGYVGSSIGSVRIDEPGEYVVRVASPADDFVVAVGVDPDDDAGALRLAAISVLVAGIVVGGAALVFAGHQRREPPAVVPVWTAGAPLEPPAGGGPAASQGVAGEPLHRPGPSGPPAAPTPWAPPTGSDDQ